LPYAEEPRPKKILGEQLLNLTLGRLLGSRKKIQSLASGRLPSMHKNKKEQKKRKKRLNSAQQEIPLVER
jgi:hypothetical protein